AATVEDCQATGLMSAAPAGDGAIGPPAPGPRTVVRREHASLLEREVRRERAVHAQAGAEDVVDNPVAFLELEDGDVGLTPDLQLADAPPGADALRRIRRGHGDDLRDGEAEAEEARHDLGHAVHGHEAAGHREIGRDAVRQQALLEDLAADLES